MNTIGTLIDKIYGNKSRHDYEQLMAQLQDEFSKNSEQAIEDLYIYIRTVPITRWSHTVMQVLRSIGFPANQKALSIIVDIACDLNAPGQEIALEVAKDMGEFTLPEIKSSLEYCLQHVVKNNPKNDYMIQGFCILMEELGSPLIDPFMPNLLQLLEGSNDENFVYEYALGPIRKIGSPTANSALPLIREKMLNSSSERIRWASLDALQDFDTSTLQQFVPILQNYLADDSEMIRGMAQRVLEKIQDKSRPT